MYDNVTVESLHTTHYCGQTKYPERGKHTEAPGGLPSAAPKHTTVCIHMEVVCVPFDQCEQLASIHTKYHAQDVSQCCASVHLVSAHWQKVCLLCILPTRHLRCTGSLLNWGICVTYFHDEHKNLMSFTEGKEVHSKRKGTCATLSLR